MSEGAEAKDVGDDVPDPDLKIILLGDSAVGKSKLVERYLMDDYNPRQVLLFFAGSLLLLCSRPLSLCVMMCSLVLVSTFSCPHMH